VSRLLDESQREDAIQQAASCMNTALEAGRDVLLYTSRELVGGDSRATSLHIGAEVSSGITRIVKCLAVRPRWLIAKGGITSSDVATRGLGIRRALVLGQILPGVPVWRAGPESRWPGMTYIVFPGNVGDESALARAVETLRG
jgi:uncharacterized protein YgbK (DUF1537 family)